MEMITKNKEIYLSSIIDHRQVKSDFGNHTEHPFKTIVT